MKMAGEIQIREVHIEHTFNLGNNESCSIALTATTVGVTSKVWEIADALRQCTSEVLRMQRKIGEEIDGKRQES
jgi:hypothetical protein